MSTVRGGAVRCEEVRELSDVWAHLTGRLADVDTLLLAEINDRTAALRQAFLPPRLREPVRDAGAAEAFAAAARELAVPFRVRTQVCVPADPAVREAEERERAHGPLDPDDPADRAARRAHAPTHAGVLDREDTTERVQPLDQLLTTWASNGYDCARAFPDQPGVGGTAVVILGDPGYGKSFFSFSLALRLLSEHRAAHGRGVVPLRVPASRLTVRLAADTAMPLVDALADAAAARARLRLSADEGVCARQEQLIRHAIGARNLLLIVDGLDEAGDAARLLTELNGWVSDGRPLVLTSRPVGYSDGLLGSAPYWQLLAAEDPEPLIRGWFGPSPKGERLVQAWRAKPLLGQALRVPLLAAMTCRLWDAGEFDLPVNRSELTERMIRSLLTTASRAPAKGTAVSDLLDVLAAVAVRTFTGERWVLTRRQFRAAARDACRDTGLDANDTFDRLVGEYNLFTLLPGDAYEVVHQSLGEWLCARGLLAILGGGDPNAVTAERVRAWLSGFSQVRFLDPRWQEVWCHLAGVLPRDAFDAWMEALDTIRRRTVSGSSGRSRRFGVLKVLEMMRQWVVPGARGTITMYAPPEDVFDGALCLMGHLLAARQPLDHAWFARVEPELFGRLEQNVEFPQFIFPQRLHLFPEVLLSDRRGRSFAWHLNAANALAAADTGRAMVPLLRDPATRWRAATALGRIGPAAASAVPDLVPLLRDPDAATREVVADALGQIGPAATSAVSRLVELQSDPEFSVRWAAAGALRRIEPVSASAVPRLVERWSDPERRVGYTAAREPAPASLVPYLVTFLRDPETRWMAAEELVQIGASAVPDLVPLLRDPDAATREVVADALGRIGEAAVPALIPLLRDPDSEFRVVRAAAVALGRIGAAAVPALVPLLRDPDAATREVVADALGRIGAAVPALIPLLRDPDAATRPWAAAALGWIGPAAASAVPDLVPLLRDPATRPWAAEALGRIGLISMPPDSSEEGKLHIREELTSGAARDFVRFLRAWAVARRFTVFADGPLVYFPTGPLAPQRPGG